MCGCILSLTERLDGYGGGELARELKYSCHSWCEIVVSSAADLVVFFACVDLLPTSCMPVLFSFKCIVLITSL